MPMNTMLRDRQPEHVPRRPAACPTISAAVRLRSNPMRAGLAERAAHLAADLARDAQRRAAVAHRQQHALAFQIIVQAQEVFAVMPRRSSSLDGACDLGQRERNALAKRRARRRPRPCASGSKRPAHQPCDKSPRPRRARGGSRALAPATNSGPVRPVMSSASSMDGAGGAVGSSGAGAIGYVVAGRLVSSMPCASRLRLTNFVVGIRALIEADDAQSELGCSPSLRVAAPHDFGFDLDGPSSPSNATFMCSPTWCGRSVTMNMPLRLMLRASAVRGPAPSHHSFARLSKRGSRRFSLLMALFCPSVGVGPDV